MPPSAPKPDSPRRQPRAGPPQQPKHRGQQDVQAPWQLERNSRQDIFADISLREVHSRVMMDLLDMTIECTLWAGDETIAGSRQRDVAVHARSFPADEVPRYVAGIIIPVTLPCDDAILQRRPQVETAVVGLRPAPLRKKQVTTGSTLEDLLPRPPPLWPDQYGLEGGDDSNKRVLRGTVQIRQVAPDAVADRLAGDVAGLKVRAARHPETRTTRCLCPARRAAGSRPPEHAEPLLHVGADVCRVRKVPRHQRLAVPHDECPVSHGQRPGRHIDGVANAQAGRRLVGDPDAV
mmetsp:Transcript_47031/g.134217  ORF Transcript_47031/g.134217 Transcript_47031/m.134217 type:complete len:292 (+) Transcript_47031:697-1572(+)